MDDLESFFWLIVWCVAEHVDDSSTKPTVQAQEVLDTLDQSNLVGIRTQKRAFMGYCADEDGVPMENTLVSWDNSWAKNPGVIALIVELGTYFKNVKRLKILSYTPAEVFPVIVEMIIRAINDM